MIYLDNNATSRLKPEVKEAMLEWMEAPCNPSSVHSFGREAKGALDEARMNVAEAINADLRSKYAITFTSSGSEANNLIIANFGGQDSVVLTSAIEHPSILKACKNCQNYEIIPVNEAGVVDIEKLKESIEYYSNKDYNILVSIMHANNETGIIQPIEEISEVTHHYGGLIHSDCVQTLGKINLDISQLNVDFASLSSHKIGGPVGAGALLRKGGYDLSPLIVGGGQEKGIRAGTENLASIAGFAKACQLTTARESKYGATKNMRDYLEAKINEISDEVVFFGENSLRLPNTSLFTMPGVESSIQLMNFDLEGFAISSGAACSSGKVETSHVLTAMNTPVELADSAIRVSISGDQEKSEIDSFINCWQKIFHRLSNNKTNMEQVAS